MSEITTLDFRYESGMKRFVRDRSKRQDGLLFILPSRVILSGSGSGSGSGSDGGSGMKI